MSSIDDQGVVSYTRKCPPESYTCCICADCITSKIYTCPNEHPTCGVCFSKLQLPYTCPICRETEYYRDVGLEKALSSILIPCAYAPLGCKTKIMPNDDEHKTKCAFEPVECPWCSVIVVSNGMTEHAELHCKEVFTNQTPVYVSNKGNLAFITEFKANTIIKSQVDPTRVLFAYRKDNNIHIRIIQQQYAADGLEKVRITYQEKINEETTQDVTTSLNINPIPSPDPPSELILSKEAFSRIYTFKVSGFLVSGYVANRSYMIRGSDGAWYRGSVLVCDKIQCIVRYDMEGMDIITTVPLVDGVSDRIKEMTPESRTTLEEMEYIYSLSEEDRVQYILERSVDET